MPQRLMIVLTALVAGACSDSVAQLPRATAQLIVFGGEDASGRYNDVWRLMLPSQGTAVWSKLSTSGMAPSPRVSARAVYHQASNRVLLFGGVTSPSDGS